MMLRKSLWMLLMWTEAAMAAAESPDATLAQFLDHWSPRYSAELQMVGQPFSSPGYHSTVPSGTWVHTTVNSLDYAHGLLQRHGPGDAQRAAEVIRKVLSLQDTQAANRTYGIWPWLLEEPLEKMSPPDWNWADFCGARLAQMLSDHAAILPADLQRDVRAALGHAARAIVKRNVGPDYTNIAIMGGGVCAAAGELLDDAALLDYGRQRLQKLVAHTEYHGGFNEYNSPTYTMVALRESERVLHLVKDGSARQAAESLRRTAWQTIAESFHPGTQQWAGPHSRAYADYILPSVAAYLSQQTGVTIKPHPKTPSDRANPRLPSPNDLPCPEQFVARFRGLPSDRLEVRRSFIRGDTEEKSTTGATWLSADACLGSVSRSSFWTQRRPVIGYWRTEADPAVVFRVRFLHDGRDFASMGMVAAQEQQRVLLAAQVLRNQGDWHPGLDRPKDGLFSAADFRLRFELRGNELKVEKADSGQFVLTAGKHRVVVHPAPGRFAGQSVAWELGRDVDGVYVDAVCYRGDKRDFDFRKLGDVVLAAGVEILPQDSPVAAQSPSVAEPKPGVCEAAWDVAGGLKVKAE